MFILDCSVTMPWILKNDPSGYSIKILKHLESEEAVVPKLWHIEVANVLLVRERLKKLSSTESVRFTYWLSELPISDDENGEGSIDRVLVLAREYHLSAYDGVYLELALRRNNPIATLDKSLKKAAHKAHVMIL